MAHYRKIQVTIWNDEKFMKLSDKGKLCFLSILTHQELLPFGALRSWVGGLSDMLGWTTDAIADAISEAIALGILDGCQKPSLLYVKRYLKYNRPESVNCVKNWKRFLEYIPECDLKNRIFDDIEQSLSTMNPAFINAFHDGMKEFKPRAMPSAMPKRMPRAMVDGNHDLSKELRTKNKELRVYTPVIPLNLDTENFKSAWQKWIAYRKEIGKALKPTSQEAALKQLESFGSAIAEQAIVQSISNGWQGLFPEKIGAQGNGQTGPANGKSKYYDDGAHVCTDGIERMIDPHYYVTHKKERL